MEIVALFKIKKNLNGLPIYLKIEQNITTFFLKKFFEIYKDKIYNIRFTQYGSVIIKIVLKYRNHCKKLRNIKDFSLELWSPKNDLVQAI